MVYFVSRRLYNVRANKSKYDGRDSPINMTARLQQRPFASGRDERIMNGFYVTLPSDPSPEYPENLPSSFKVRLPQRLTLPGQVWHMALSSMSAPDTRVKLFNLIPKEQFMVYARVKTPGDPSEIQVNMSDIDALEWVMDGESFVKACVDIPCISELKIPSKEDSF